MAIIKIEGYECSRCEHQWAARKKQVPIVCPECKSPYWNLPKKNKMRMKVRA